jgi:excisionase family DNA binding protein
MAIRQTEEPRRLKLKGQTLVTVDTIASYCMVSSSTVRRWIRDGRLSAFQLPSGHFRVRDSDFVDFLKRYNIPGSAELMKT